MIIRILFFWILFFVNTAYAVSITVPSQIHVNGSYVYLHDVFVGVRQQDIANKILMKAPLPGHYISLNAGWLEQVAILNRIHWSCHNSTRQIMIYRDGEKINSQTIQMLISEAIRNFLHVKALNTSQERYVVLPSNLKDIFAPLHTFQDLSVSDISVNKIIGTFSATLHIEDKDGESIVIGPIVGRIQHMFSVIVPVRQIMPGDIITRSDIRRFWISDKLIAASMLNSMQDIIGKEARVPLRINQPIFCSQIQNPILVKRGDLVLVVYQRGPLRLTVIGKALNSGSLGEQIALLNITSHKKIIGIVRGQKSVEVI